MSLLSRIKTIRDIDWTGKRALVRVDFNVPLDEEGHVSDSNRISEALPTIQYLCAQGAKVILISHLGRPKGSRNPKYSLHPVRAVLSSLLGREVKFLEDCIGPDVVNISAELNKGDVLLLENLRFHSEEVDNDPEFSRQLSQLGDVYVNDAFGVAHREHSSNVGLVRHFSECVAGFLLEKELKYFSEYLSNPKRPFVVLMGGSKVSDKIGVLERLIKISDTILIGGAMSYTFLKAEGISTGSSMIEEDKVDIAKDLLREAKKNKVSLLLPSDHLVTNLLDFENHQLGRVDVVESIPEGFIGVDIGPKTIDRYQKEIMRSAVTFWNGPMGVFEIKESSGGTFAMAESLASSSCLSIVGGGDSASAIRESGFSDQIDFISTGGGASLQLIEGKPLPAVEALLKKYSYESK